MQVRMLDACQEIVSFATGTLAADPRTCSVKRNRRMLDDVDMLVRRESSGV
jgi:hypothetical protein